LLAGDLPVTSSAPAGRTGGAPASSPVADATSRGLLGLVALGAAVVLQRSWATVRPPFDAGLAAVIVVGVVHGVLSFVPTLRIPARLGPRSYATYGAVLLLSLLATPDRPGDDRVAVLGTRLACWLLPMNRTRTSGEKRRAARCHPGRAAAGTRGSCSGPAVGLGTARRDRPDPHRRARFRPAVRERRQAALGRLAGLGIPILFTTTPVPAVPVRGDGLGSGPFKMNDAGRTGRLNQLSAGAVVGQSLAAMVPYAERISNLDGTVSPSLRPDGLHLRQNLGSGVMDRGLEADLRGAYQQVTARVASSTRGTAHHWSRA